MEYVMNIIMITIVLFMTGSWQYCNAQQGSIKNDGSIKVRKLFNNHMKEIGVDSRFLNLKSNRLKQKEGDNNRFNEENKNMFDKQLKVSEILGNQEQFDQNKIHVNNNEKPYIQYHINDNNINHGQKNEEDKYYINKDLGIRHPDDRSEHIEGTKHVKNNNIANMLYTLPNVSENNVNPLSKDRKFYKPMDIEQYLNLEMNNATKYKVRPENKFKVNHYQYSKYDPDNMRNGRDIKRKHQTANIYVPWNNKKIKSSLEPAEESYSLYNKESIQNQNDAEVENKEHLSHKSHSDRRPLIDKIKNSIMKSRPENRIENDFEEESQLSNLNGDVSENLGGYTRTTPSYKTTKGEKPTPLPTEHTRSPEISEESIVQKHSEHNISDLSEGKSKEYEYFLRGHLVDDFVKTVLTKVARSKKIMLELGFTNATEESCERCAELIPCEVPDLEDMKQSMEILSTQDTMKCYKLPVVMSKYLSLIRPHKRVNKNSTTNKGEEDNFIFREDYTELLSEIDHKKEDNYNSQESVSKSSLEKKSSIDESIDEINGGQISNVHDVRSSDLYNIPSDTGSRSDLDFEEDSPNKPNMSNKFIREKSNHNNNDARKYEDHSRINELNEPSETLDSKSFKDTRSDIFAQSHYHNDGFDPLERQLGDKRELGNLVDRNTRKLKNKDGNIDEFGNKANPDEVLRPQYDEEYDIQSRPQIKLRSWSRSKLENKHDKDRDGHFENKVKSVPYSNSVQQNRKEQYVNSISSDYYNLGSDYVNNPQLSIGWHQNKYDLSKRGLDEDVPHMAIPNNRRRYEYDTRILKRDTQPPSEVYSDVNTIFHEINDMEYYDLY